MSELKRVPIKYIRDFLKKNYKQKENCYICNSDKNIELHHLYSLAELFDIWCTNKKITTINSVEFMSSIRIEFEETYKEELSNNNLYSLCKVHHLRLHTAFGQSYPNRWVTKVKNWIEVQKRKYNGATSCKMA